MGQPTGQSVVLRNGETGALAMITTIKRAAISASSNGNNTVISAVTGKKIKVLSLFLIASSDVNVKFQSAAGGTDLTGLLYLTANSGFVLSAPDYSGYHWFETVAGELLNLNLSGAVAVGGCINYYEEA